MARKRVSTKDEDRVVLEYYRLQIVPLLPKAVKAFGPRTRNTPAHRASSEYTRLLCEFYSLGGSLLDMSDVLGVNYSGVRRRVLMSDTFIDEDRALFVAPNAEIPNAIARLEEAKAIGGTDEYHRQILKEYRSGFSMQTLAKGLKLNSTMTLYYGAQRAMQKEKELNE